MAKRGVEQAVSRVKSFYEKAVVFFKSARGINVAQNCAIVLLLAGAALLFANTGVLGVRSSASDDSGTDKRGTQSITASGSSARASLAGPYAIAVTNDSGSHCGMMFDGTELTQAYDRLSAYLGEALGSAGEPSEVTEKDWKAALKTRGVYFDFGYEQPVSVLATSMGTDMSSSASSHSAARFCLTVKDDKVVLYYLRGKTGTYYKCSTAISGSAMAQRLGDFQANGASFLFETDYEYPQVDDCFLVQEGQAKLRGVMAQDPVGTSYNAQLLTEIFGINTYIASHYTEKDGTVVYVDGSRVLRIYTNGRVQFADSGETGGTEKTGAESKSELSSVIGITAGAVEKTIGKAGGIAKAGMSYVGYDQKKDEYTVRYGYEIGGYPVTLGEHSAAQFSLVNGKIVSAELNFREYSYTGEDDTPLPAVQAMAVVQASGGGTPLLCYVDDGSGVTAGWTIIN